METVRSGKANCIVVKDLSRFGRDYVEAGNYLEHIFPFMGVRFISISDGYDNADATTADCLTVALKNMGQSNVFQGYFPQIRLGTAGKDPARRVYRRICFLWI